MRFSTILVPFAALASLVLASPLEERATKLTAVASAPQPKGGVDAVAKPRPGGAVHAEGTGATLAKPGRSKRSDYNELDRRKTDYGTFYIYAGYGCTGYWNGISLPVTHCFCYWTFWYNSVYVAAGDGLNYGVYVAANCYGIFHSCTYSMGLV